MVEEPRTTLTDGRQIYPEHSNLKPNGQQNDYVVLAEEERAKGFIRPVRRTYTHRKCNTTTTMGQTIAETYARDPSFYSGTFCVHCKHHYPLINPDGTRAFLWEDGTGVGT